MVIVSASPPAMIPTPGTTITPDHPPQLCLHSTLLPRLSTARDGGDRTRPRLLTCRISHVLMSRWLECDHIGTFATSERLRPDSAANIAVKARASSIRSLSPETLPIHAAMSHCSARQKIRNRASADELRT